MHHSLLIMVAVVLAAVVGALHPGIVVAGVASATERRVVLRSAVIAAVVGLALSAAGVAIGQFVLVARSGDVLLLAGLVGAVASAAMALAGRGEAGAPVPLATSSAVLVGVGHVLGAGPALFGLSSFLVDVAVGAMAGAVVLLVVAIGLTVAARRWIAARIALLVATVVAGVVGAIQVCLHLVHALVGGVPTVPPVVVLGLTVLAGVIALLVGAAGAGRRVRTEA